jgi:hypothetical protein
MSQAGSSRAQGKGQRPYGPDNPPPPPVDPPPSKPDRKRGREVSLPSPQHSPPAKGAERPWKMLNSRRRKKRRLDNEELAMDASRDCDWDRSTVRKGLPKAYGEQQSSRPRHSQRSPMRLERDENRHARRWNSQYSDRQPLREARQFTPDQIVDETYGRLSPGMDVYDYYQKPFDEIQGQSLERTDWPDEPPLSPYRESCRETEQERQLGAGHNKGEHSVMRPP